MKDSTRRALRTGLDLFLGVLLSCGAVLLIPGINDTLTDMGLGQAFAIFSLVVLVLTTFVTKFKNYLEDEKNFPALLKAPASGGENPVPDRNENPKV